jgi:NAD(P)-dependent dehydrogenase (short-subunit alcohol dehydrogenase family)
LNTDPDYVLDISRPPPRSHSQRATSCRNHGFSHSRELVRGLDPQGTVLVTGGTGELGGVVARHLATAHGARGLLLVGRRGERVEGGAELRAALEATGAEVTVAACDVTDPDAVRALLDGVPAAHPLTAVVHAAGVLDDGLLPELTPERMAAVLRPKVDAAWLLHRLTEELDLAQFVLFSSAAGTLGNAGQGSYAAANAVLDALAEHRHARGLPATSLAWGLWARTGTMTSTDHARLARLGIEPLDDEYGMALYDAAVASAAATLLPARIDPAVLGRAVHEPESGEQVPVVLRGLARDAIRRRSEEMTVDDGANLLRGDKYEASDPDRCLGGHGCRPDLLPALNKLVWGLKVGAAAWRRWPLGRRRSLGRVRSLSRPVMPQPEIDAGQR